MGSTTGWRTCRCSAATATPRRTPTGGVMAIGEKLHLVESEEHVIDGEAA
jgi:hypothetical protein